jgi:lipopolysaccharide transport system ATP-binding protein
MTPVISVENLSKRYIIGHQTEARYTSLRDVLTNGAKRIAHKLAHPFITPIPNPTHEEFWALKDVSFDIQQGDRVGIIGRNGAGKSTLLKILSRITEPTSGKVSIRGRVASLLEVGTGFHPELSGRENIFLNGAILGMSKAEITKQFDAIVDFAEVERFLDTPVKHYSSGMYVRLAFAVAAHLEPEILIVDEVLAVGDAQFQRKCLGKMGAFKEDGRTVIFVSHNIGAVNALCTRVLFVDNGTLLMDGDPNVVSHKYLSSQASHAVLRVDEIVANGGLLRNSEAIVTRLEVRDDLQSDDPKIDTDSPFHIEIQYIVLSEGASIGLNLIVHDNENNCIFGSINNHEPVWYGRPMPTGDYKSVCHIPKHFLNNGLYRVSLVLFTKEFTTQVSKRDLLVLEIHDGKFVRGDYSGSYASVTRPLFVWETAKI